MKKCLINILIIFIVLLFGGCTHGSSFTIGSLENNTTTSMYMKHIKFSGNKNTEFNINEGEYAEITVDITTESGKIDLYIRDDKDNIAYEGNKLQTGKFTVTIKDSGKYKIRIEAKDHKGSYLVKWNIKNNN